MKKIFTFMMIFLLVISSSFAALLRVGPTGRYKGDVTDIEGYKSIENYDIGIDARVNLGLIGVAANALVGGDKDFYTFNTIMTANARMDIGMIDLALGAGFELPITWKKDTSEVYLDGQPVDKFMGVFEGAELLARASAGVNLGGLGVALDCVLPFKDIESIIDGNVKVEDALQKTRTSISFLINLL